MENNDRFITSTKNLTDAEIENSLRPTSFDEYIGQTKVKESLSVYILSLIHISEPTRP